MDSKIDGVWMPPAPADVDSNVITLPTLEVIFSSPVVVGNPDNPVMDDAALGTVESPMSLFPVMETNVAGGVLLSAPNELNNEDIGSTSILADAGAALSLDVDRVGGCGETVAGTEVDCALMDGTPMLDSLSGSGADDCGTNDVGTNSLAVARIIPIGFVSTGLADTGSGAIPPD